MSDVSVSVALDAASLARIHAFANYGQALEPELETAMLQSVQALETYAYAYMWRTFQNPTGPVEDSLGYGVDGPYQAWMGSDHPAARRLNYGFSGKTDSLGRTFAEWPIAAPGGYLWAEHTWEDKKSEVDRYFALALGRTLTRLSGAGGTP